MKKGDIPSTDRADYAFRAAENPHGTPWIMLEPRKGDLKILTPQRGFLGLELRAGTSFEEAKDIAHFLDEHIGAVTCTTFDSPAMPLVANNGKISIRPLDGLDSDIEPMARMQEAMDDLPKFPTIKH